MAPPFSFAVSVGGESRRVAHGGTLTPAIAAACERAASSMPHFASHRNLREASAEELLVRAMPTPHAPQRRERLSLQRLILWKRRSEPLA